MNDMPLVKIDKLCVDFQITRARTLRALDDVSLTIKNGETVGLVGESGCGKTTLGRAVKGLSPITSGSVEYRGVAINKMTPVQRENFTKDAQMIFQDPYSSLDPRMTVREIIKEGMKAHNMGSRAKLHERVDELLELVGLNREHANRFPHEFSGGQRQRVGIARALALDPAFLICDEPTSALDVSIQAQIITLLKNLRKRIGLTFLFISHDMAMVKYVSDRIVVMYLGKIVEIAPSESLYENPLHPYTRSLISSIQVADPIIEASRQRVRLKGDISNQLSYQPELGVGKCKLLPRCPYVTEACYTCEAELVEYERGHFSSCAAASKKI
jgi:oligopeptide/dipeptide ABC transporter ATP-binding protein